MLECDNPLPKTKDRFGGYGGVFEYLLARGAKALDSPSLDPSKDLQITKWQVEEHPDKYPQLEDIDAILITGSSTKFPPLFWFVVKDLALIDRQSTIPLRITLGRIRWWSLRRRCWHRTE